MEQKNNNKNNNQVVDNNKDSMYNLSFNIDGDLQSIELLEDKLNQIQELKPDTFLSYSIFEKQEQVSWNVKILFASQPDQQTIDDIFNQLNIKSDYDLKPQKDIDWLQKNHEELAPFYVGPFFIYGSFDRDNISPPDDSIPLMIDAATAFGSGRHETTKGCLFAIDDIISHGIVHNDGLEIKSAADIGCGSGILAMAIALRSRGNIKIIAIDNDKEAIRVAKENCITNKVNDHIECLVSDGFSAIDNKRKFDLIVANILATPLIKMADSITSRLSDLDSARLILSGILNEQADEVIHTYKSYNMKLVKHNIINDWSTIIMSNE